MSQMELRVRAFLGRRPEIEKCYRSGLVNRRALARFLVSQGIAGREQFGALVATLRRLDLPEEPERAATDLFAKVRFGLKDRILILDFEKEKALLERLEKLIAQISYDRGETFKVVVGTSSVKLLLDEEREAAVRSLFGRFRTRRRTDGISEISMQFPEAAIETPGILAVIARELVLHDITIAELLTASPELLIYLRDEHVPAAYALLRGLQGSAPGRR